MAPTTPVYETDKEERLVKSDADPEKDDIRNIMSRMEQRSEFSSSDNVPVEAGRPDVAALIQEAVKSVSKEKRVLIAACGPDGLMKVVRNTAASLITNDGPAVELHCEQFGW